MIYIMSMSNSMSVEVCLGEVCLWACVHLMGMYLIGVHLMGVYFLSMHLIGVYLMACISYRRELSIISTNDFVCEVTPHANSPSPELAIEFAPLIHSVANPRSFIGSWR